MILPNMDALQKHIEHAKALIHDNNFSIVEHMMELSKDVQIASHASKVLQENWNKTMVLILKVHYDFLSRFGTKLQILYTIKNGDKNIIYIELNMFIDKGREEYYTPHICIQERYMYGVVVICTNKSKYVLSQNVPSYNSSKSKLSSRHKLSIKKGFDL